MTDWWATEDEIVNLAGVPANVLRRGVEAGLFEGLAREVDGAYRYSPDAVALIAWSDKLGDDVVAGRMSQGQAKKLLWRRAAQIRRRSAELDRIAAARS
ncbi:MAG: hypothetical protein ACREM3_21110 [Candidatus Rokuibacteriota bacterium]